MAIEHHDWRKNVRIEHIGVYIYDKTTHDYKKHKWTFLRERGVQNSPCLEGIESVK